jgi:hypothetical protein
LRVLRFIVADQLPEPFAVAVADTLWVAESVAVRTTVAPGSEVPVTGTALMVSPVIWDGTLVNCGAVAVVFFVPLCVAEAPVLPAVSVAVAAYVNWPSLRLVRFAVVDSSRCRLRSRSW